MNSTLEYFLKEIFENLSNYSKDDLAYSAHVYIAEGLAQLVVAASKDKKVEGNLVYFVNN